MWEGDRGLPVLQPVDVALADVSGRAAQDHGCSREQVRVSSHEQVELFGLPPLNVNLPLGQDAGVRLDCVWNAGSRQ